MIMANFLIFKGPDRFSRFDVYWKETRQAKYIKDGLRV